MRFSDIHSHFVYGMDDGAQTLENMEAMLDAAAADGVSRLIATPHMTPGVHQFNEERLWRHLSEARAYPWLCFSALFRCGNPVYACDGALYEQPPVADLSGLSMCFDKRSLNVSSLSASPYAAIRRAIALSVLPDNEYISPSQVLTSMRKALSRTW